MAADDAHLEIIREDGVELAVPSLDEVFGRDPAGAAGRGSITALHLDEHGLWGLREGGDLPAISTDRPGWEVFRLDPTTAAQLGSDTARVVGVPSAPAGRPIWWFSGGPVVTPSPGPMNEAAGVVLDAPSVLLVQTGDPAIADRVATPNSAQWRIDDGRQEFDAEATATGPSSRITFTAVRDPRPASDAPRLGRTGLVNGWLERVGGPAPGAPAPVGGDIWLDPVAGSGGVAEHVVVPPTGRFRIPVVPGRYTIRGTSGAVAGVDCAPATTTPLDARADGEVTVHVECPMR